MTRRRSKPVALRVALYLITVAAAAQAVCPATAARGANVFSQTPPSNVSGNPSDTHFLPGGRQLADDFTVAAPTTVRSITWRGLYAALGNSPAFPLSFDVTIYGNNGSDLPDTANVLSATTISFASAADVVDTGQNTPAPGNFDVYEYRANLTPTPLTAGTKYWLSVYADMTNDVDDDWLWTSAGITAGTSASRDNAAGNAPFTASTEGPVYFVLDNAAVPEPAALTCVFVAGLASLFRRRRPRGRSTTL